MARDSWNDGETKTSVQKDSKGTDLTVNSQFRMVECPAAKCDQILYHRVDQIHASSAQGVSRREFGLEQGSDLHALKKLGPLSETNWLVKQESRRAYRFTDGMLWIVRHRYLVRDCPRCSIEVYLRLTQIDITNSNGQSTSTLHVNHDWDLARLQALLIEYLGDESKPVHETQIAGQWFLTLNGVQIAEEIPAT